MFLLLIWKKKYSVTHTMQRITILNHLSKKSANLFNADLPFQIVPTLPVLHLFRAAHVSSFDLT